MATGLDRRCCLLVALLVLGVGVVESGLREVPHQAAQTASVSVPGALGPVVERLRGEPATVLGEGSRSAVVSGVVFGRTDEIPAVDRDRFIASGLWHLLAASGQNVALVISICMVLAWAVGGGRLLGAGWALFAVPAYVLVVGGGPSIVRAGIMGELAVAAWLMGRLRSAWDSLLVAAVLLVWAAPGCHRTLGFQLSFACVATLLAWCAPTVQAVRSWHIPAVFAEVVAMTVLCSVVTAPLLLARTGQAPLLGAVANVVAVPIAGVLLVVGLLASCIGLLMPVIAYPMLMGCGWLAAALLGLARMAAAVPGAATSSWVVVMSPLVLVGVWRVTRSRRVLGTTVFLLALAAAAGALAPDLGSVPQPGARVARVVVLDIGQGSAQLVQSGGHALIVDTGPPDVDLPRLLRHFRVRQIDGIVLTHDSLDHRGNALRLFQQFEVGWLAIPTHAAGDWRRYRAAAPRTIELCAGARLKLGSVRIAVLHPRCEGPIPSVTGDSHNDNAIVMVAQIGSARVLLTSDAEAPVTSRLQIGHVDVLQVGHHGSADPQLAGLLAELRPRLAIISCGRHNRYGHPRSQTISALQNAGVAALRTDQIGHVVIETDGERVWRRA